MCIETLADHGVTPGLVTALMSDDSASETYVNTKQQAYEEIGIEGRHHELNPETSADTLEVRIEALNENPAVHGILAQMPVSDHVDEQTILERIDPVKNVDGFHPEDVGKLVTGEPRFQPCTPHGIQRLLAATGVETTGKGVVVIEGSNIVEKPMTNLLVQKAPLGNVDIDLP